VRASVLTDEFAVVAVCRVTRCGSRCNVTSGSSFCRLTPLRVSWHPRLR